MKKSDWVIALAIALCAIGLVACGGGSSSGGDRASREEAVLEFAECMRAHGAEVEDPKPGKGISVEGNDPATKTALAACKGKLGDAAQELSPEEGEEFKEGWLAFAQCMRKEGIDMPDPEFLGPGKVHLATSGIDTGSPAFNSAREACQGKTLEPNGINIGG